MGRALFPRTARSVTLLLITAALVYVILQSVGRSGSSDKECLPGEPCFYNRGPPRDWKLQPYNGWDEDSTLMKRLLQVYCNNC